MKINQHLLEYGNSAGCGTLKISLHKLYTVFAIPILHLTHATSQINSLKFLKQLKTICDS